MGTFAKKQLRAGVDSREPSWWYWLPAYWWRESTDLILKSSEIRWLTLSGTAMEPLVTLERSKQSATQLGPCLGKGYMSLG